jgi:soluble lytic murein transglycosylase-like protein
MTQGRKPMSRIAALPSRLVVMAVLAALVAGGAGPVAARTNAAHQRLQVKRMVIEEARRMRFPVALALAVAHAESNFDATARSHKGARGVMQIMPATSIGEYGIDPELLWRPGLNIRMGIHFLGRLIRRYRGRTDLALSYYNGGSAVGAPGRARVLPATYGYVRKVRSLRRRYMRELLTGAVR